MEYKNVKKLKAPGIVEQRRPTATIFLITTELSEPVPRSYASAVTSDCFDFVDDSIILLLFQHQRLYRDRIFRCARPSIFICRLLACARMCLFGRKVCVTPFERLRCVRTPKCSLIFIGN